VLLSIVTLNTTELPFTLPTFQNAWPEMLQTLLSNVTGQFPDGTKIASLEALGYMCDEVRQGSALKPAGPPSLVIAVLT
jgi:hypothetical protein